MYCMSRKWEGLINFSDIHQVRLKTTVFGWPSILLHEMSSGPTLDIAICGAGIAGLTAAISLLKHPRINVQIYEQATELREVGASIALGPNGLRTLQRLGLERAISDEVCHRGPSGVPMIYKHWKTNEILGEDHHEGVTEHVHHTARYLRAHLQEALLENVPRELIHLGKKFDGVKIRDDGVQVSFKDGTTVSADILLGADGLRSVSGAIQLIRIPRLICSRV